MEAEVLTHPVPLAVTLLFTGLLVAMIVALALEEKLHAKKSVIVGVFAVICLLLGSALGLLPFGDVTLPGGQRLHIPVYIEAVDWEVIAIIVGSSLFVDVTLRSGLFGWIAIRLTKASGGDPLKLLWFYGGMTVLFSAALNNVTAMIIVGSLSVVSLERLERRDKLLGFLLIEGLLTNVGGLLTLISSVPNIIVGNAAGIGFIEFFLKSSPYVLVATVFTLWLGARLFGIRALRDAAERDHARRRVAGFDENEGIASQGFFTFAAVAMAAFILAIATTSVTPVVRDLGMGFVAMTFAVIMLIRYKSEVDQFFKAVDWDLILFFMSLFVVINVMEHAEVLALIGEGVRWLIGDGDSAGGSASLLLSSALFSSVTDNIPLTAMLARILDAQRIASESPLWWAVAFGANLGGNLTPIGSASTLVAVTLMHKHGLPMSFGGFVRRALPFAVAQITVATAYVLLFL